MVFDGGSTDDSVAILRRYDEHLAYWESQPDRGQAHAINKGLKRAKGRILGWLNSDDVLFPRTVAHVVEVFQRREDVDVVYGRLERIDQDGNPVPTPTLPKDVVEFNPSNAIGECPVNQPGSFWRREMLEQVGYLREDLDFAFDYEYWLRILLAGGKFMRLPHPVAKFRLSAHSKTVGQTATGAQEHLRLIDEFMANNDLAEKLGISQSALRRQARTGKSILEMYAFYGRFKQKRWLDALRWFARAHASNPLVLFKRRWFDLALARLKR